MLARITGLDGCKFVTVPDVVGDAQATRALFDDWEPELRELNLPVAYVGQDGQAGVPVPWNQIDAFFIGGSTEWKLGPDAAALTQEAKRRAKWVHMGRVNSRKRIRYARSIGCDSVDGTSFSMFPDRWIPKGLEWISEGDQ